VVVINDPQWREYLLFREALRDDEPLRARYAVFERSLREGYPDDRSAYTAAKRTFVRDVLLRQART